MEHILDFKLFETDEYWKKRPDWIVFDKNHKLIDFNLPFTKANRLILDNNKKQINTILSQNGKTFESPIDAQKFLDTEKEKKFPTKKEKKELSKETILKKVSDKSQNIKNSVFIRTVAEIFDIDDVLIISSLEFSEDLKDIKYAYLIIDDKYYDKDGFHTKSDIMKLWKINNYNFDDMTFKKDVSYLKKMSKEDRTFFDIVSKMKKDLS